MFALNSPIPTARLIRTIEKLCVGGYVGAEYLDMDMSRLPCRSTANPVELCLIISCRSKWGI